MSNQNALEQVLNQFKNILNDYNQKSPSVVGNLLTGREWNQDIGNFGGKLIKPIPEKQYQDNNNQALQQYYNRQWQADNLPQTKSTFQPKTVQYPDWVANAPKLNISLKVAPVRELPIQQAKIKQAPIVKSQEKQVIQSTTTTPTFKFQNEINQASKASGLDMNAFHLLRAGENQAENPSAINYNSNGTLDVGLFQINVDPRNRAEVERLKNPVYNAMRAAEIFKSRMNLLKDPVLAIASYNLGAGGAVLRPMDALKRAQWVYYKAGVEMPQTEFTKNPLLYVRQNMDYYKQLGLFR
ncbi:transglycosylase SLT domain-containing protein [Candidatus Dojkabacteria bacterium]|jgi:hypothetical protein|nr:transglycosylase SLT domain-containing protein [Candidatus Dojkabacteria bacterium]